jgi:hypothetical protein
MTQRARLLPENYPHAPKSERLPELDGEWHLDFPPIRLGGYSSRFGFFRREIASSDSGISRPLAVVVPIRTIDQGALVLMEQYGAGVPDTERGAVSLYRSLLQRLEAAVSLGSHDYFHNAVYPFRSNPEEADKELTPYWFSHLSAPIYQNPPRKEMGGWEFASNALDVTNLEQLSLRFHRESMAALLEKKPQMRERIAEQAVRYLNDVARMMEEVRAGEGKAEARDLGRFLAGVYLRELWVLLPPNDAVLERPTRAGVSVNAAIRKLGLDRYNPPVGEAYDFLDRANIIPLDWAAADDGADWRVYAESVRREVPRRYGEYVDVFVEAELLPVRTYGLQWGDFMEARAPGWLDKFYEASAGWAWRKDEERARLIREFHAEHSEDAVKLLFKARYLASRCSAGITQPSGNFSKDELVRTIESMGRAKPSRAVSDTAAALISGLFGPGGPAPDERALLQHVLNEWSGQGIWNLTRLGAFTNTHADTPAVRERLDRLFDKWHMGQKSGEQRFGLIIEELSKARGAYSGTGGGFFGPVPADRGLWLELGFQESGLIPWLHGNTLGSAAPAVRTYSAIIDSATLTGEAAFAQAVKAYENPPSKKERGLFEKIFRR